MTDIVKKFQKLDGRHKGNEHFKYYIDFRAQPVHHSSFRFNNLLAMVAAFLDVREQCWRTYGYSCELEAYLIAVHDNDANKKLNQHYAWSMNSKTGTYRIYLKGDAEKAWLSLLL